MGKGATGTPKGAHVVLHRLVKTNSDPVRAVLLCKRTLDAPIHPGYWGLFGGTRSRNKDANARATATREVWEELKLPLSPVDLTPLCRVKVVRGGRTPLVEYFTCPADYGMDELTLQGKDETGKEKKVEGEGLGWFTAEEIHHLTVRPEDRIAINEFFKKEGA
jgi:8-oxo-dGTP pyrophosphatase MutT (NUDIX family)